MSINLKEDNGSYHVVLSSSKILSTNSKDIEDLLMTISKKYDVTISDAAFALTNVFKNISNKYE